MSDRRFSEVNGGGHPDAERLAEYADGVLTSAARADVEHHLADCETCREVLADTMSFLAAEPDKSMRGSPTHRVLRFPRRRLFALGVGLAAAAAAVAVVSVAAPQWLGGRRDRPELQELVAALVNEPTRLLEGRLTGGFPYAPPPAQTRGSGGREASPDVRIAAARIEQVATERDTPENRAALGVAHLVFGDLDKAVADLERAVAQAPDRAGYQSDLSALYLARARLRDGGDELRKALVAAEGALAAEPRLEEACFNRALALEGLGLRSEALAAWEGCLRSNPGGAWTEEIRQHIARLNGRGASIETAEPRVALESTTSCVSRRAAEDAAQA